MSREARIWWLTLTLFVLCAPGWLLLGITALNYLLADGRLWTQFRNWVFPVSCAFCILTGIVLVHWYKAVKE